MGRTVQWVIEVDDKVPKGKPEMSGDGMNIESIRFRCHPDDEAEVMAKVKAAAEGIGGTNIRSGRMQ